VDADLALLRSRERAGAQDALVFYSRDRPCISLGHFSREEEFDARLAAERGLQLVRRASGGRPIYSDRGQINYALALGDLPESPREVFALVCGGLVQALRTLGVEAVHHAPNDIEARGRKISGSAMKRGRGASLVHGTLLVSTDLALMADLFPAGRGLDRLTDLRSELGAAPSRAAIIDAVADGLGRYLATRFEPDLSLLGEVQQRDLA
jgi:lipoate-protein ligase A